VLQAGILGSQTVDVEIVDLALSAAKDGSRNGCGERIAVGAPAPPSSGVASGLERAKNTTSAAAIVLVVARLEGTSDPSFKRAV